MNYKKYKHTKLNPRNPQDKATVNFANIVNRFTKDVRAYTLRQLDKEPSGLIIKFYLMGMITGELPSDLEDMVESWNLSLFEIAKYMHELVEEGLIKKPKNYLKSDAPKMVNNIYFNYHLRMLIKSNKKHKIVELVQEYIRRGIEYNDENFRCPHCGRYPIEEHIENVSVDISVNGNVSFNLGGCKG